MTPDQGTDPEVLHNKPYDRLTAAPAHPRYRRSKQVEPPGPWAHGAAHIGDEVAPIDPAEPASAIVVAIYLDGMVELSTGDQVPAADLVLLRRAQ